jgi:tetratricopeptide (TPR) repeat protein
LTVKKNINNIQSEKFATFKKYYTLIKKNSDSVRGFLPVSALWSIVDIEDTINEKIELNQSYINELIYDKIYIEDQIQSLSFIYKETMDLLIPSISKVGILKSCYHVTGEDDETNSMYDSSETNEIDNKLAKAIEYLCYYFDEPSNTFNDVTCFNAFVYVVKAAHHLELNYDLFLCDNFENYISKADQSQIGSGDYATYANVLFKLPGNDSLAGVYIDKAVQLDTLESSKIAYLKATSLYFENQKNYKAAADWYAKILTVKKAPTSFDLNTAGLKYFKYGNYTSAIDIFSQSSKKYPEDVYGYYMTGKSYWAIDTTMEQGLANPAFQKVIEVGLADKVKNKAQLIASYKYFVVYYANIKKDKAAAMAYCDSVLVVDPADAEAASNKAVIEKMNMNPTPPPATPATKTTKPAATTKPVGDKPKQTSPAAKQ